MMNEREKNCHVRVINGEIVIEKKIWKWQRYKNLSSAVFFSQDFLPRVAYDSSIIDMVMNYYGQSFTVAFRYFAFLLLFTFISLKHDFLNLWLLDAKKSLILNLKNYFKTRKRLKIANSAKKSKKKLSTLVMRLELTRAEPNGLATEK